MRMKAADTNSEMSYQTILVSGTASPQSPLSGLLEAHDYRITIPFYLRTTLLQTKRSRAHAYSHTLTKSITFMRASTASIFFR